MKTKNNIQKAIFTSLAVSASLVLIGINVNAQYYWNALAESYNSTKNKIALLDNSATSNSGTTNVESAYAFLLEKENEEPLGLENWMMNDRNFSTTISIKEEVESPLKLENWMTSETVFNASSMNLEVEREGALELQNWMTNENYFSVPSFQIRKEKDVKLELQDWMFNENLFHGTNEIEQPLQLEDWMISEKNWSI